MRITLDWEGVQGCNLLGCWRMSGATSMHTGMPVHLSICKWDMSVGYK